MASLYQFEWSMSSIIDYFLAGSRRTDVAKISEYSKHRALSASWSAGGPANRITCIDRITSMIASTASIASPITWTAYFKDLQRLLHAVLQLTYPNASFLWPPYGLGHTFSTPDHPTLALRYQWPTSQQPTTTTLAYISGECDAHDVNNISHVLHYCGNSPSYSAANLFDTGTHTSFVNTCGSSSSPDMYHR